PGGQLVKQTHRFFGSRSHHSGTRGIDIAPLLIQQAVDGGVDVWSNATAIGLYDDLVLGVYQENTLRELEAQCVIVATGAAENMLSFPGNDLPGVYGAGAVQTLMNVHGVRPGQRVLMVGAGNIGVIVSYQLLQAGVAVAAIVEALPFVGGYQVHAAKVRRAGVPILTRHTVVEALGDEEVTGAVIAQLDDRWCVIDGTQRTLDIDTICLAVGLTPLSELLWQAGCQMRYVPALGGHVAVHDERMETTRPGIYVAGDASGIEEASTAMLEGRLAGLAAALRLRGESDEGLARLRETQQELALFRGGPYGAKVREGKEELGLSRECALFPPSAMPLEARAGTTLEAVLEAIPPERLARGPVAVVECLERIPCNPCVEACPQGAISMPGDHGPADISPVDINALPVLDADVCTGCGLCVSGCPGLAIFIVDTTYSPDEALVSLPYEFLPLPAKGAVVTALDRDGQPVGEARVVRVRKTKKMDRTAVVSLAVPVEQAMVVRGFKWNL
ncbi:MAG: FAD-dependent oxidoreductase, partial [Chloroflexi bacterium]|nr:FAD-dependent oxidoreductase [Chloroflexota bacterium]